MKRRLFDRRRAVKKNGPRCQCPKSKVNFIKMFLAANSREKEGKKKNPLKESARDVITQEEQGVTAQNYRPEQGKRTKCERGP